MNQCDGCKRGLPVKDGIHYNPETGYYYMVCTKDKYVKQEHYSADASYGKDIK